MSMDEGMKAITAAMQDVREKVGYVRKNGENTHFKYKFAGEADFLRAIRPAMVEAGLMMLPQQRVVSTDAATGIVYVEIAYTLAHKDGHIWPEKIVGIGTDTDRTKDGRDGGKAVYKALTGASKYALRHLFQIETGDDPEEDRKPERVPKPDEAVVETCLQKIEEIDDLGTLETWWNGTKEMLPNFDIVPDMNHPGGPHYLSIVDAMKKRVLVLKHAKKEPEQKALPKAELNDDIPF
jgi:hypothetical protein